MTTRVEHAENLSTALASLDDDGVLELLRRATSVGIGIGGSTKAASLDGSIVFIKQLPLTKLEESNPTATLSRLKLPFVSHYGIGSPSHGVGREFAAHRLTSDWVLKGEADFFPILLGSRIIDIPCESDLREFEGETSARQWGTQWPEVEQRLCEMKAASKSMVLFLEYVPETLGERLRSSIADGSARLFFAQAVEQIVAATTWMKSQGFLHFDVHPGNILVRQGKLLLTDFGLSLSSEFNLTAEERALLPAHDDFDSDTALMHLFHWTLYELGFVSSAARLEVLRAASQTPNAPELDRVREVLGDSAELLVRHAGVALYMTEMFSALLKDAAATSYSDAISANCRRKSKSSARVPRN